MDALESPDTFYLVAAIGWLELGNFTEAKAELGRVDPVFREHPDVLEVYWMVHSQESDWEAALASARALLQTDPQRCSAWLHQAYALRRLPNGGIEAAWEALLPAYHGFPSEPTIPYNLACYACQLGRIPEARKFFLEALSRGEKRTIKKMALDDPDLQPLWQEIRKL